MSEARVPNRFDSIPQELLDKIYGYVFDLEDAKVTKVNLRYAWSPPDELTYVLSTALLRVNRAISEGAQKVLYNKNLLVLFRLTDTRGDIETAFRARSQYVPISIVPDTRSLPPCPIIVNHRRYKAKKHDRPRTFAIVIRALDFPKFCKNLNRYLRHDEVERDTYSLMALPEAGWPREQLRSLIWEPLRGLQHVINRWCAHSKTSRPYDKIKAVDDTGTFEPTKKLLGWEAESQHEDSKCDDSEAYNHNDGGYERDRECPTCGGCGVDYETDSDWSSEEDSNSGEDPDEREDPGTRDDPDSKAKSHSEVHKHTSETITLERGSLGADDEPYLGDDEGVRRGSIQRRRKR